MKCDDCGEDKNFWKMFTVKREDNTKNCGSYHNPTYPKKQVLCESCLIKFSERVKDETGDNKRISTN